MVRVSSLSPLNERLEIDKIGGLNALSSVVGFVNFIDELKLLLRIVQLVLSDSTVDHANQRSHIALIKCNGFLVD